MQNNNLPDIQETEDKRNIPLKWVGVEDVVLPFNLLSKDTNRVTPIQSKVKVAVGLPHNFKGTHMSRFIEVMEDYSYKSVYSNEYFGGEKILEALKKIKTKLHAEEALLEMDFTYFIPKKAPVSNYLATMDYKCKFRGTLKGDEFKFYITVEVPIMNVCPCSKEISDYGAHNQRGYATVTIQSDIKSFVWLEDLIQLIEQEGSAQIYPLLKRVDEKWVTERSYENPKFVEDVTRDIILALNNNGYFEAEVSVKTIESIHNHQAFAYTDWKREN